MSMTKDREALAKLCFGSLEKRGLGKDERYRSRLMKEFKAIEQQGEYEYFLETYKKLREKSTVEYKMMYPGNPNNLLVGWLLDIAQTFDINKEYITVVGEQPDIDIDYIRVVRDYVKRDWAPAKFGREYICEIGTYGTSGIKGSILDMARVHGLDIHEAQNITVKIKDKFADDEGNTQELKWEDALKIYPELKAYLDKHPQVAKAAQLLQDRNRTGGVHAGGLIISSVPIDGFVPLEVRMVNKDHPNGVICSAWTEGLNAQDLQPVGLIKFDLLVINNLLQIAYATDLIKKRHGLDHLWALPGSWDWSDISYLNDPKCIEMANSADLKCIFQFDSEGIRKMVKRGGVSRFDDLAVYSALYRPGPLNMGMDARYCKRKQGEEPWNVHPLLQPSLGGTYGVMVYQEQVMDILKVVGGIPDMHTEKVRKAISKKKVKQFIKYKDMFIENGQVNLGVNEDFVRDQWDQIESFAEYGFNKSHAYAYTMVSLRLLAIKAHYPLEFYTDRKSVV
jgi:DNA polymerase-3 subunit alpha